MNPSLLCCHARCEPGGVPGPDRLHHHRRKHGCCCCYCCCCCLSHWCYFGCVLQRWCLRDDRRRAIEACDECACRRVAQGIRSHCCYRLHPQTCRQKKVVTAQQTTAETAAALKRSLALNRGEGAFSWLIQPPSKCNCEHTQFLESKIWT